MWVLRIELLLEYDIKEYQVGYFVSTRMALKYAVDQFIKVYEFDTLEEAEAKVHYLNGGN